MITDENDFLGYLISKSNSDDSFNPVDCQNNCGLDLETFLHYMKRMNHLGYVSQPNLEIGYITSLGKTMYVSPQKKIVSTINKSAKLTLKRIISILIEIGTAIVVAYLIFKLGVN